MIKSSVSLSALSGMFPQAEIITVGSGPYWTRAEIVYNTGKRLFISDTYCGDITEDGDSIVTIKLIGDIDVRAEDN